VPQHDELELEGELYLVEELVRQHDELELEGNANCLLALKMAHMQYTVHVGCSNESDI